jgi:ribose-phosphate pyrophosphokinase
LRRTLVFSTRRYDYLRAEICQRTGFEAVAVERLTFPDGEHYQRLLAPAEGADAVVVGGTISEADTLELYDLACGLVQADIHSLTLAIPYFGYATMERVSKPGEIVTAKTRARLLSSIPVPGSGSRVLLLDLHSEGVPFYFEGSMRPVHLRATPVILAAARRLAGGPFVFACTDAGRAKWVEALANQIGVGASFVFKRRIDAQTTEVSAMSAHVQGAHVVIYDDMIRTGSSLLAAARAYRQAGAAALSVVVTHGVLPGNALARLEESGLFTGLSCTNSHPRALELAGSFLQVDSIAGVFADYLGG